MLYTFVTTEPTVAAIISKEFVIQCLSSVPMLK